VNAFLSQCRHRGNRLCRADVGNASAFTCAYHGWAYGNDGHFLAVPNIDDEYFGELNVDQWALVPVDQLDSYKGLYFTTFDPGAPPLLDYLGSMTWYLDAFFDRREWGIEVYGGVYKWVVPCNWKFPAENFGGDAYHVGCTHLSAIRSGFSTGMTAEPTSRRDHDLSGQRPLHHRQRAQRFLRYPKCWRTRNRSAPRSANVWGPGAPRSTR
jgi:phenylpropionate dioxygenase-like ring-hydroxylating dioxygenase large terminal subunit